MPVARAAFFATRLSPAPVFRTALFADLIAFVVLDFLRLAFFMISFLPKVRSAWLFFQFVPYAARHLSQLKNYRAHLAEVLLFPI